jgi:hypothetical protein
MRGGGGTEGCDDMDHLIYPFPCSSSQCGDELAKQAINDPTSILGSSSECITLPPVISETPFPTSAAVVLAIIGTAIVVMCIYVIRGE